MKLELAPHVKFKVKRLHLHFALCEALYTNDSFDSQERSQLRAKVNGN